MDKPIYFGISIIGLSTILMYETYYDKIQPYFSQKTYNCYIRSVIVL